MDRRKFLKKSLNSAKAVSLLGLTGCAALDRYFEIEKSDYSKEVLIFGGGISGLCTAYMFKKNGIPYRVFEGANRIGGRILSQRFPDPIGGIDLGARYVDSMDHAIVELIKEMNIDLEEAPFLKNSHFFCLNKDVVPYKTLLSAQMATIKAWNKELATIRRLTDALPGDRGDLPVLNELRVYDKVAFADILNDSKMDFKSRSMFKAWAEIHFQKKVTDISYLEWLYFFEKITLSGKKMYFPGGLSQLVDIMGQRVSGVIPNYNMQLESRLVEISRNKDRWVCHIRTREGLKKLSSPFVVLALPFNQLKHIKGIETVFTDNDFLASIKQAQFKSLYRIVLKSSQKSIRDNGSYVFFESSQFSVTKENLFYTVDSQAPIDWATLAMLKGQMTSIFGVKDFEDVNAHSWTQTPWINGGDLKLTPQTMLVIKNVYSQNWDAMTLQLVGDYLYAPESPSLNECVRSAQRAAKNITALMLEKEWT